MYLAGRTSHRISMIHGYFLYQDLFPAIYCGYCNKDFLLLFFITHQIYIFICQVFVIVLLYTHPVIKRWFCVQFGPFCKPYSKHFSIKFNLIYKRNIFLHKSFSIDYHFFKDSRVFFFFFFFFFFLLKN